MRQVISLDYPLGYPLDYPLSIVEVMPNFALRGY